MSKDLQTPPKDQKLASGAQFQSGLDQSQLFGVELEGKQQRSPSGAPAESARRWQIRYADLTIGESKGRGAYGEVFIGKYRKEDVAIKLYDFRGQLPEKQQVEILHEAELMGNLRPSKYLVGFRGICFDPRYCLVMEFCDGGTLRARLDNAREIAPLDSLRWAMQISYGIYNLHEAHILHRDLKGENILLDTHSQAKVADFGLSVVKSSSASQSKKGGGSAAGTLPWMAPELFAAKPPAPSADVYSLGMVLWEIASRQQPLQNVMAPVIIGMALAGTRPPVEAGWPLVFKTLMQACWDADPAKRPTAQKVGEEFEAALSSVESAPKVMPKSAEQLKIEQLEEKLRQAELKQQEEAKKSAEQIAAQARQSEEAAARQRQLLEEKEKQLQLQKEKESEDLHRQQELQRLQEENERLKKQQQSLQTPAIQSPQPVIPAKAGIHPPVNSDVQASSSNQSPIPTKTPPQAVDAGMDPRLRGDDTPVSAFTPASIPTPTATVTPTQVPLSSASPPLPPTSPLTAPSALQNPQSLIPAPKLAAVHAVDVKEELGKLLQLVAEGEQDQAETMIQQNKQLLLASGQVTDLSGRMFQNITTFQYALWAMDYHMWTMIKRYLPAEAQVQQFNGLESKSTEHGKHYDIKPLTDALQIYVDNAAKWNYDQRAADQWNRVVGGAQKLVPVHVVNEYTRPDRSFGPCPTEWESKLPRTKEVIVYDVSQWVIGSWFIVPQPSSSREALGYTFAFYRYNNKQNVACGVNVWRPGWRVRAVDAALDLKALQSLWKARAQQLELLRSEFMPVSAPTVMDPADKPRDDDVVPAAQSPKPVIPAQAHRR